MLVIIYVISQLSFTDDRPPISDKKIKLLRNIPELDNLAVEILT